MLHHWCGRFADEAIGPSADVEGLRKGLRTLLAGTAHRHAYPAISRLFCLKVKLDDELLSADRATAKGRSVAPETVTLARDLIDLNERLNAPLHFTPLHAGFSLALLYLRLLGRDGSLSADPSTVYSGTRETSSLLIYRSAQRYLNASEQMYTMRRDYYEAISKLFYLYDDFNDRQIHYNHAIQMAGSEMVSLLKACLKPAEDRIKDIGQR